VFIKKAFKLCVCYAFAFAEIEIAHVSTLSGELVSYKVKVFVGL
jgi:hypothetical protein